MCVYLNYREIHRLEAVVHSKVVAKVVISEGLAVRVPSEVVLVVLGHLASSNNKILRLLDRSGEAADRQMLLEVLVSERRLLLVGIPLGQLNNLAVLVASEVVLLGLVGSNSNSNSSNSSSSRVPLAEDRPGLSGRVRLEEAHLAEVAAVPSAAVVPHPTILEDRPPLLEV
jgi:hypothetical protein